MSTTVNQEKINILSKAQYDAQATHSNTEIWAVEQNDASTTGKGVVQLATNAEVTTGTNATKAVTPASLKIELDKKATPSLVVNSINNHNTSASSHSTLFAGKQNARTTVTDTTSTTATIANVEAGKDYVFTQAVVSLTISSVETSMYESTISFTSGNTISVSIPASVKEIGSHVEFEPSTKYIISFWNNTFIVATVAA